MYTSGITFLNIKWPAPTKPTPQPDDSSQLIPTASHLPANNHGDAFQTDSQLINHGDASIQFEYGEVSDLPVTSQNDVYSDRRNLAEKLEINENYIEAYKLYDELVNQFDDAYALFKCAVLTMRGHGIAQDYKRAIKLFEKVSDQIPMALKYLGDLHKNGPGTTRDYGKAFDYYSRAANLKVADAFSSLGELYMYGHGVKKNHQKALELNQKAIELGDGEGLCNLGIMYELGYGVERNYLKAANHYLKAKAKGCISALNQLGRLHQRGLGVPYSLSTAVKYYQDATKFNHADANNNLGECYLHGLGVKKNILKAFSCFLKAAKQYHAKAWYNLGWLCEEGEISYENEETPFYCYHQAAILGVAHAWMKVGQIYLKGIPEFDIFKAIKALKTAAKMYIPEAYYELGGIYEDDSNYLKAFEYYLLAVVFGVAEAWSSLERFSRKNLCDSLAISSLIKTANLSSLNLSGIKVSDEDISFLIKLFKINDAIQIINLSQTQISDQALQA